jgi:8-oxo-dGTP pyrophosphatase MutT (NUDIX family)
MGIPRAVAVVLDGAGRVLVMRRWRKRQSPRECRLCGVTGVSGPECPGHRYAVLPGGHVEEGESTEVAAVRELTEETSLTGRIDRLLWTGWHYDRPSSYFLMTDVEGRVALSGPEAEANVPDNRFELYWAAPEEFASLGLRPQEVWEPLTALLRRG